MIFSKLALNGSLGQSEFVGAWGFGLLLFNLSLQATTGLAICGRLLRLWRIGGQFSAVIVEVSTLRNNDLIGLGRRGVTGLGLCWNFQHSARFHPIDVVANKGVRVGA